MDLSAGELRNVVSLTLSSSSIWNQWQDKSRRLEIESDAVDDDGFYVSHHALSDLHRAASFAIEPVELMKYKFPPSNPPNLDFTFLG